jgi:hypothetical protein
MTKKTKAQGFTIPWETADQITLASLKDHRDVLKNELKQWRKNPKTDANPGGYWLHPEDVGKNEILIHHMDAIINYYGG